MLATQPCIKACAARTPRMGSEHFSFPPRPGMMTLLKRSTPPPMTPTYLVTYGSNRTFRFTTLERAVAVAYGLEYGKGVSATVREA